VSDDGDEADDLWSQPPPEPPLEERPRRNPPRDWAAPPPWASGGPAASAAGMAAAAGSRSHRDPPDVLGSPPEAQGLAGSAADRLARGEGLDEDWAARPSRPPRHPDLAGWVSRGARQAGVPKSPVAFPPPAKAGRRPTVSSTRDRSRDRD